MNLRYRLWMEFLEDRTVPATVPLGFSETIFAAGLESPTAMAVAPDGRIFVAEQAGRLRVVTPQGGLLPASFLSLNVDPRGERGLLGVTFDPDFEQNGFVYVYYTVPAGIDPVHNRVSRFTAAGDRVVPGSEVVLLQLNSLTGATNHNGGALHFGADGKLYVAVGENATPSNSQTLDNLLGKVLRINKDGSIPTDNPFFNTATGVNRAIWTLGLRNPFTFAVQPGTGRIFINDVGGSSFEEINEGIPGANYGWPITEGPTNDPRFVAPLFSYPHGTANDQGFAITGGTFYNPPTDQFPTEFVGDYFFADFVNQWVRRLDFPTGQDRDFATDFQRPVDLRVDANGSLLVLQRGDGPNTGSISRVSFDAATVPTIASQPVSQLVSVGGSVTFAVTANGPGTLNYQWTRNGVDIPGATGVTFTLDNASVADDGSVFRVRVTNDFGQIVSDPAVLSVTSDQPPVPVIVSPAAGTRFTAGDTFTFIGSATDPETGTLPRSALTWRVDYVTGGVPRPFVAPVSGVDSITFEIPRVTPFLGIDVSYRVVLTATDPAGLQSTVTRDLFPNVGVVVLEGDRGDVVMVDGTPRPLPFAFEAVAGTLRTLEAPLTAELNGRRQEFVTWSDGDRMPLKVIEIPDGPLTLTTIYSESEPLLIGGPGFVTVQPPGGAGPIELRPGFPGSARVAVGDVNGDRVPDWIVASGPGGPPLVRIFDGGSGELLWTELAFEESFTGGVFVSAADFTGDGFAEIILSPDEGGGPRVRVFSGRDFTVLADFFGIEDADFRGGVRTATGDFTADGVPDLLVGAGFGGGPRVALFDGRFLSGSDLPPKLVPDFFVFEEALRNGAFLAAGDINGDRHAELVAGAGPGGGPRVLVISGRDLLESPGTLPNPVANFFAGDVENRGGVRVAVKSIETAGQNDLVVAAGEGAEPLVTTYLGSALTPDATPEPFRQMLAADAAFRGGIFVG